MSPFLSIEYVPEHRLAVLGLEQLRQEAVLVVPLAPAALIVSRHELHAPRSRRWRTDRVGSFPYLAWKAFRNSARRGSEFRFSVATVHLKRLPSVAGMPFFDGLVKPDSQMPSGPYSLAFGSAAPTSL